MKSLYAVLFDIDGTLLRNAGPQHKESLIEGIRQVMKVECTLDGIDTAGRLDRDLISTMLMNAGIKKARIGNYRARVMEAAQHHYTVNCRVDMTSKLCPGVLEVLEMLKKARVPIGLVTGNLSAIAWRKMQNARIEKYFSFGAYAEQAVTRSGLARLAIDQARKKGLTRWTSKVTLIGDHANDIEAAQKNSFRAVAVATGVMRREELAPLEPNLILDTLEGTSLEMLLGLR